MAYKTVYLIVRVKVTIPDGLEGTAQKVASECDYNVSMPIASDIHVRHTEIIAASDECPEI